MLLLDSDSLVSWLWPFSSLPSARAPRSLMTLWDRSSSVRTGWSSAWAISTRSLSSSTYSQSQLSPFTTWSLDIILLIMKSRAFTHTVECTYPPLLVFRSRPFSWMSEKDMMLNRTCGEGQFLRGNRLTRVFAWKNRRVCVFSQIDTLNQLLRHYESTLYMREFNLKLNQC